MVTLRPSVTAGWHHSSLGSLDKDDVVEGPWDILEPLEGHLQTLKSLRAVKSWRSLNGHPHYMQKATEGPQLHMTLSNAMTEIWSTTRCGSPRPKTSKKGT